MPATKGKNGTAGVRVAAARRGGAAICRAAVAPQGRGRVLIIGSMLCCAAAAALLKGVRIVHPSLACKVTLLNEHFCYWEISFTDVSH